MRGKKSLAKPPKAITAVALGNRTGQILRELENRALFVILRRNRPIGILQSLADYVSEHQDEYEDVQDFIDTWLEETDPEFQRSLREGATDYKRENYLTRTQLKVALSQTSKKL